MKLLRPFSITVGALILVAVWAWIGTSNTDYRPGSIGGGRTTAGWFLLGFPFLFLFGLLASLAFSFVARQSRPLIGWLCVLAVFIPLIAVAIVTTTPSARLREALGIEPPAGTQIQIIQQFDSLNDGIWISGICSANRQLVSKLVAVHRLQPSDPDVMLQRMMPKESISNDGNALSGNDLTVFYDEGRSLLYFSRHLGSSAPDTQPD